MLSTNQPLGIDQCNCNAMRRASRQITRLYDAHLQPVGLRITQFLILAALAEAKSATVNMLAERLDVERTAMGKMVGTLERDGFVTMKPSPTDGRYRVIELTLEGDALHEEASPLWNAAQVEFAKLNGAKSVATLRKELDAIVVEDGVERPDA
ncbi:MULTISPECIES: MarR family winged helix-turn-helix transcriptional regulator [unclassified Rhizobium]|jgi:DNA-binding MarR family transcriptional regulator|uniref:MarR family winged helix-turn-helix transcriptional regulator n=1 Tax=unclassified Rhizobium TaxID=2613769 RepID=UPI00064680F3|nr:MULTISPECIES: MarR family winged helix-turn-helix transcriptional regulator [unclassified Rhizobium]OJY63238.1 MAG: transcriptional regulator [Rhizobium sp. 60-20]RKD50358.1 MarR family transcriptional regulator [Rhizobium sp. WW_1]